MTSSETPTDESSDDVAADGAAETSAAAEPVAAEPAVAEAAVAVEPATMQPRARAVGAAPFPPWILALAVVPPGWFFILRTVRWHLTSSAVMLMICWVAIVTVGYFAIRMALSAASSGDTVWFTERGEREWLEREKRSLLKAIKEIEFDRETGKLSTADAASLTAVYRARAIEVIKSIEAQTGSAQTVREQILADVRARQAVEANVRQAKVQQAKKKKAPKDPKPSKGDTAKKETAS